MEFFDAFLSIGRCNDALPDSPCDESQALAMLDRFGVTDALVYSTAARDCVPDEGNASLANLSNPRLHKVWVFDPAIVIPESPADFVKRALANHVKAIMVNPLMRNIRMDRSPRILELAKILEGRKIPLLVCYRQWDAGQDLIDWYQLADFCNKVPNLPVISWEWRSRANRPMMDALAETKNLLISLSSVWQAQMLETLCDAFGPRLVFSLGLPNLDPAAMPGVVAYAPVNEKIKRAVAGETMKTLLKEANYEL
jgi:predicted TIM-barrel fold metal-dependent hydrolase